MNKEQTATAVHQEYIEKLQGAAFGNIDDAINSLSDVFQKRKKIADMILKNDSQQLREMFDYLNNIIKKTLYL